MRRSLFPAVLILLMVTSAACGTALAAPGPGDEVTVEGTVTGVDGDPAGDAVVLLGEDATLTKHSPDQLREFADSDPANLTVVEVDDDGRFETTVAWEDAEAAVALDDDGISDLAYARRSARESGGNVTLDLQLYERRPQTVHAHAGTISDGERRTELYVNLGNSDDVAIENLSVSLSLPAGWSVADVTTNGSYHSGERTLTWSSVAPDGEVDTTVVLAVPEDETSGEYTVELRAESDSHRVDVESETVEVFPEDTPGPTRSPGGDAEGPSTTAPPLTPTDRSTPTQSPSPANASGPGLEGLAAVTALALLAALLALRR